MAAGSQLLMLPEMSRIGVRGASYWVDRLYEEGWDGGHCPHAGKPIEGNHLGNLARLTQEAGKDLHLWMFGDAQRSWVPWPGVPQSPTGPAAFDHMRWIRDQIGPYPHVSIGMGFDLHEWTTWDSVTAWAKMWRDLDPNGSVRILTGRRYIRHPALDVNSYDGSFIDKGQFLRELRTYQHPRWNEERFRTIAHRNNKDWSMAEILQGIKEAKEEKTTCIWGPLKSGEEHENGASPLDSQWKARFWEALQGDDMTPEQDQRLKEVHAFVQKLGDPRATGAPEVTFADWLARIFHHMHTHAIRVTGDLFDGKDPRGTS